MYSAAKRQHIRRFVRRHALLLLSGMLLLILLCAYGWYTAYCQALVFESAVAYNLETYNYQMTRLRGDRELCTAYLVHYVPGAELETHQLFRFDGCTDPLHCHVTVLEPEGSPALQRRCATIEGQLGLPYRLPPSFQTPAVPRVAPPDPVRPTVPDAVPFGNGSPVKSI